MKNWQALALKKQLVLSNLFKKEEDEEEDN